MSGIPPTIAVLDDEPKMRQTLRRLLGTHGFLVREYETASDLIAALAAQTIDCLVLDLHMPGMGGLDVLESLAGRSIAVPVVVLTGHEAAGMAERTRALGASAFLTKPVGDSALVRAITSALYPQNP